MSRPLLAIIVPGGIGSAGDRYTIPAHFQLLSDLAEQYQITVFSLTTAEDEIAGRIADLPFTLIRLPFRHDSPVSKRLFALFRHFHSQHRQTPFQLVHGFWGVPAGFATVLLAKYFRLPSVVSFFGGETVSLPQIAYGNLHRPMLRWATRFTARAAQSLVVLSGYQRWQLQRAGMRSNPVEVIPFGTVTSRFQPARHTPTPPYNLYYLGNINAVKNPAGLIDTFNRVADLLDCRLHIIGPDYSNGLLQQQVDLSPHREKIIEYGYQSPARIAELLPKADVLLITSLHEGQSLAAVEAMAAGVPVCGFPVGILADRQGAEISCPDQAQPDQLALLVSELLQNVVRHQCLRELGLRFAHGMDHLWTARQYHQLYHEMLSGLG
jgi:glycogen(starch) synthase